MKLNINFDECSLNNRCRLGMLLVKAFNSAMLELEEYNPELSEAIEEKCKGVLVKSASLELQFDIEGYDDKVVLTANHNGVEELLVYTVDMDASGNIVKTDNNDEAQGKDSLFSDMDRIIYNGATGLHFEPIESEYIDLPDFEHTDHVLIGDMEIASYDVVTDEGDKALVRVFSDSKLVQEFECSREDAKAILNKYRM